MALRSTQIRRVISSGHILLAGTFESNISFGCSLPFISSGAHNAYIARLDPVGTCQWNRRFGDSGSTWGSGITVDSAGNIYYAGRFDDTIILGGVPYTSNGDADIFVAAFAPTGTDVWSKRFGGTSDEGSASLTISPESDALLLGSTTLGAIDFGTGALVSAGSTDIVIAKLAP
jgi:hypothetical protein